MKSALILEGGGMRGLYTAGVLDVLMENDIYTDVAVGVSAGALFGINYKSKQIGRVLRYNLKYAGNPENTGWKSFVKTGNLMNKEFWFEDIPFKLDPMDCETYRNNGTEFHAVVTNLQNGRAEYKNIFDLENGDCMEYLRASGSLPFCSKPVVVNGIPYLDGGIADSIPLKQYFENGYEKAVVVLTRPKNYRKNGDIHGAGLFYKKYPEFSETLKSRNRTYNEQCEYVENLENEGRILVIRPSETVAVSRTEKDPAVLQKMYNLGVKDCMGKIAEIKNYLIK